MSQKCSRSPQLGSPWRGLRRGSRQSGSGRCGCAATYGWRQRLMATWFAAQLSARGSAPCSALAGATAWCGSQQCGSRRHVNCLHRPAHFLLPSAPHCVASVRKMAATVAHVVCECELCAVRIHSASRRRGEILWPHAWSHGLSVSPAHVRVSRTCPCIILCIWGQPDGEIMGDTYVCRAYEMRVQLVLKPLKTAKIFFASRRGPPAAPAAGSTAIY